MANVMDLRFSRAHFISVVIPGMKNPKAIGSKSGQRNGRENLCGHRNGGEIYSGKLRRAGPYNLIIVDIFATRDKKYGTCIRGIGFFLQETCFPRLFL